MSPTASRSHGSRIPRHRREARRRWPPALLLGTALAACGGRSKLQVAGGEGGLSTSSTVTTTTPSGSSSSSTGGGTLCMLPAACGPDAYCSWSDQSCGGNDGPGVCAPRPDGCGKNLELTCGCDGTVYDNPCEANRAGADVDVLGGCQPPPGMFGCGAHFCPLDTYYCKGVAMSGGSTYGCELAPAACGGVASCDCLTSEGVECVGTCLMTMDGGILLACEKS